jgi:hypothetical protein
MINPLVPIEILSIYKNKQNGQRILLPKSFATCTPDTQQALIHITEDVKAKGGNFYLSDLFRSHDMQLQAHLDFVSGKKKAFSPPPGGSMHEAGRGFDIDLGSLKMPLKDFWDLAAKYGVSPIIDKPISSASEAWHFDCRGSHHVVYEYYRTKKGRNIGHPYTAMAMSAILADGIQVDAFKDRQKEALIQSGLIRLGMNIGNMDGFLGPKSRQGLADVGVSPDGTLDEIREALKLKLEEKFPLEFFPAALEPGTTEVP